MSTSDDEKRVKLDVKATLYLDPEGFAELDEVALEDLRAVYEIMETRLRVEIDRGSKGRRIRGTIRFITPTPHDLKAARLASIASRQAARDARKARRKADDPPAS